MPATTTQVNDARAAIQYRADNEGSQGARLTFGSIDGVIDLGPRLGKISAGQSWQSGGGVGPMEILMRGILDSVLDVLLRDAEPAGTIKMFNGLVGAIPLGWSICDGSNGTPDLRDRFILGSATAGGTGGDSVTGGPNPVQTLGPTVTTTVQAGTGATVAASNHTHNMASHTHSNSPPHYRLIFIMKVTP